MSNIYLEPWYKSRRIWGAILMGCALALSKIFPEYSEIVWVTGGTLASLLGITSWTRPKL